MSDVVLHGWPFSPYLRAVRLALVEAGVTPAIRAITPGDLAGPDWRALSPFGKVPAFEHGAVRLSETVAILAYVDAAFAGDRFLPAEPERRGRSLMIALAAANYLYPTGVMGVFFRHAYVVANGGTPDSAAVAIAAAETEPTLEALEPLVEGPFAVGDGPTVADFLLAPMLANLAMAPAGEALLERRPRLRGVLDTMAARPSFAATQEPIPLFGLG